MTDTILIIGQVALSFVVIIAACAAFGKLAQKISGRE
jgi:hypothetical protein